jgi:hypothetical protein
MRTIRDDGPVISSAMLPGWKTGGKWERNWRAILDAKQAEALGCRRFTELFARDEREMFEEFLAGHAEAVPVAGPGQTVSLWWSPLVVAAMKERERAAKRKDALVNAAATRQATRLVRSMRVERGAG